MVVGRFGESGTSVFGGLRVVCCGWRPVSKVGQSLLAGLLCSFEAASLLFILLRLVNCGLRGCSSSQVIRGLCQHSSSLGVWMTQAPTTPPARRQRYTKTSDNTLPRLAARRLPTLALSTPFSLTSKRNRNHRRDAALHQQPAAGVDAK